MQIKELQKAAAKLLEYSQLDNTSYGEECTYLAYATERCEFMSDVYLDYLLKEINAHLYVYQDTFVIEEKSITRTDKFKVLV